MALQLSVNDFNIKNGDVFLKHKPGVPGMLLVKTEWCGYCQRFKPTFNKLANLLGNGFICAVIDGDTLSTSLSTSLKVSGYPSIFFFDQSGKIISNYSGDRSESDLLKNICSTFHHCISYHK
jgi:thiol-disulfide isomerase/thioredoxin